VKVFWALALFAAVVLGGAAVWLGGINQDEGWYLYAANMVSAGQMPYRDFFYTQGPLLPFVYSPFSWIWKAWGLLGARLFTLALGGAGIIFAVALARRLVPAERKNLAGLTVLLLLGCNLYHLYYCAMPKTYALAALFVALGFYLLSFVTASGWRTVPFAVGAGASLALAAGTRISLGALLCVVGLSLLCARRWKALIGFCAGGFVLLALVYVIPFVADAGFREGLLAAQKYHAARGGFDIVFTVGSLSRLVRWYLPLFVMLGLGVEGFLTSRDARCGVRDVHVLLWGFLAVFLVQMLAPFPYEDYQVPIMGLLAVYATVTFLSAPMFERSDVRAFRYFPHLLVLGLAFATAFGSPLLEKWTTNGQDRFWSLKKERTELAQLQEAAKAVERLDPGGRELLTQDLYLAVETNRRVPHGLEMGPFSILSDAEWRTLLASAPCPVAAVSGYTFAIEPPVCNERPMEQQLAYLKLLKNRYSLAEQVRDFGQNATTLLLLKRNDTECPKP